MTSPRRSAAFVLWLLLLALSALQVFGRTQVENNLAGFLPSREQSATAALLEELQNGRAAQLILLGISGGSEAQRAAASQALGERLREDPAFSFVGNGQGELDPALLEMLLRHRYLLSPAVTPERFDAQTLRQQLQQRLEELASPVPGFDRRWLRADPTAELRAILRQWSGDGGPARRRGVWFSPDGERALLLVRTRAQGFDLDAQQQVLQRLRDQFAAAADASLQLSLSGPAVFAVNARDSIRGETQLLSLASGLLMMLLLLAAYRSPRLLLLGALPVASGMLVATACVSLVFGGIHGITLAFGITLLGVAIDYPLHLFSHLSPGEPPVRTVARIWPTLRLGVVTTVAGYAALALTDFPGLSQLGLFTIVGLLTAAAFSRWMLPSLLPANWVPPPGRLGQLAGDWALRPRRLPVLLAAAVVAAAGLYLLAAEERLWEDDLAALSPIAEADRRLDRELRAGMRAPEVRDLVLIRAPDSETLLQRSEALRQTLTELARTGALGGFELPSRYLPSTRAQRDRQALLPAPEELEPNLRRAAAGLPFKPEAFQPFVNDVAAARLQAPLTLEDVAGTPLELRLLPLISHQGKEWRAFIPLSGVQDRGRVAAAVSPHSGVEYLDTKAASEQLLLAFRDEALLRIALGLGVIVLALWLGLGSPARALGVLLPVLAAVLADLAALVWLGERLSLFHLISLLLVAGIGLDYSLFFARREDAAEQRRTLHAVGLCAVSSVAVFSLLGASSLPVLRAIGLTAAIGVALCFFFAWAVHLRRPFPAPAKSRI